MGQRGPHICHHTHVEVPGQPTQQLASSFIMWALRSEIIFLKLTSKDIYQLSHLANPSLIFEILKDMKLMLNQMSKEMSPWVGTLATLPEDLSPGLNIHTGGSEVQLQGSKLLF